MAAPINWSQIVMKVNKNEDNEESSNSMATNALVCACLLCGSIKPSSHMRSLCNVKIRPTNYQPLLKEVLNMEVPTALVPVVKLCESCIHRMKKFAIWRKEALSRLNCLWTNGDVTENIPQPSMVAKTHDSDPLEDHSYAAKDMSVTSSKCREQLLGTSHQCVTQVSPDTLKNHCSSVETLITFVLNNDSCRLIIEQQLAWEINQQLQTLCTEGPFGSVLNPVNGGNVTKIATQSISELQTRVPFLFKLLVAAGSSQSSTQDMYLFPVYAILMNHRSQRVNMLQRLITTACMRYHAGNEIIPILHSMNLSVCQTARLNLLEQAGKKVHESIIPHLMAGVNLKITIDNLDGRLVANQVRMKSGNRDYHYTHWTLYPDRFNISELNDVPQQQQRDLNPDTIISKFYCTPEENENVRYSYAIYVAKILCAEIDCLGVLKSCLPSMVPHRWENITKRKSAIFPQGVILKSSTNLPNCVSIMDTISENIGQLYGKAGKGDEFAEGNFRITVGGDQLMRTNLDSARNLRAGAHTKTERLEHLSPIVTEFFHVQQDLLEKIYKVFFERSTLRQLGTFSNLKSQIGRTNVNGDVKANQGYEAHKDFALLITKVLIIESFMEWRQMDSTSSSLPLPQHIQSWGKKKKLEWLLDFLKPFIDELYVPFKRPNQEKVALNVVVGGQIYRLQLPPTFRGKTYHMAVGPQQLAFLIPPEKPEVVSSSDELHDTTVALLRVMLDFIFLGNIIRAGDADNLNVALKRLIPTFIGLTSYRSKYFIELINFITKTDFLLGQREGTAVKLRSFVNPGGTEMGNKPADMQQENSIKLMKTVMKGLGGGKTEAAVGRVTLAADPIHNTVSDLQGALGVKPRTEKYHYHQKDDTQDKHVLLASLRQTRPFQIVPNRTVNGPMLPSVAHKVDKFDFESHVKTNIIRAINRFEIDLE